MARRSALPSRPGPLLHLSSDGWLLFATTSVRNFAASSLSVVLGLYLAALGLEPAAIGGIFTVALVGGALMTAFFSTTADRVGRRLSLILCAALMVLAGAVFLLTENLALLLLAALIGSTSPAGKETGPFLAIEQAILPQTTADRRRTGAFVAYSLAGALASAFGALAVALPAAFGLTPLTGYRALVAAYVGAGLLLIALFSRLSPAVEAPGATTRPWHVLGLHRSRGLVARLALLAGLDAFAGGFMLQSLAAYWFSLRYALDTAALGAIFFGSNLLAALSLPAAAPLARRFGLLNTLVYSHLVGDVLLILVPFMPSLELAATVFLARHLVSQIDVPTRQSFAMAVVAPDERSATAGLTTVARNTGIALAPALTGVALATPALGLPFLISGGLKIVYALAMLATFRNVHPPEEIPRAVAARTASSP